MKILIHGYQIGNLSGTGRYTEELVKALIKLPDTFHIILSTSTNISLFSEKLTIQLLPPHRHLAKILQKHYLQKLFKTFRPDIVHYPATYGYRLGTSSYITTIHDLAFLHNPNWFPIHYYWFYKKRVEDTVRFSHHIITDSYFSAKEIQKYYHIPDNRIDVIYLGVSDFFKPQSNEKINSVKHKYKLPEKYILYIGTLEPRKNIPTLIQAWSNIANKVQQDLVIVGRKGWKTHLIEKTISISPYKDRIYRLGYIEDIDLPAIINGADIFVYISLYEGFGLPPLEAMHCGTPVIASNTGSLAEILTNGALLVNPYDIQQISEAIRYLCEDTHKRQLLAQQGITHAQKFTWEKTAQKTLEVYKNVFQEMGNE